MPTVPPGGSPSQGEPKPEHSVSKPATPGAKTPPHGANPAGGGAKPAANSAKTGHYGHKKLVSAQHKTANANKHYDVKAEDVETDSQPLTNPLAEQAAAMMLEDVRSFSQGAEQLLLIAIAKGLAKVDAGDKNGVELLNQCKNLMEEIPKFAKNISSVSS